MINFELNEQTKFWIELSKKFTQESILNRKDLDQHGVFPQDLYQKAFDLGLLTFFIPSQYGGKDGSYFDLLHVVEQCAYGDLGFTSSAFVSRLALSPLLNSASEELKKQYIQPFCSKLSFASFCFTEIEGSTNLGTRPASTTFEEKSDGWVITGSKYTITNANYADFYIVFARDVKEQKGLSCFLIPKNSKGVQLSEPLKKMGQRASNTGVISFDQVQVPQNHLIGKRGEGAPIALRSLKSSRIGVGAMALGVARRARDLAKINCYRKKTGSGSAMIYEQDIQFRLADIEAKIDMMRAYLYQAVWEHEKGKHSLRYSSGLKLLSSRLANEIVDDCLEMHGGSGYLEEYTVEKLARDTKLLQIYEGTEAVQRMMIADSAIRLAPELRAQLAELDKGELS